MPVLNEAESLHFLIILDLLNALHHLLCYRCFLFDSQRTLEKLLLLLFVMSDYYR